MGGLRGCSTVPDRSSLSARQATQDTVLPSWWRLVRTDPVAVQAGTTVAFNTYLLHRRSEFWGEDAWEFRPERWEGRKFGWEYIPFHGGPQTCSEANSMH